MRRSLIAVFVAVLLLGPALPAMAQDRSNPEPQYEIVVELHRDQEPATFAGYFLTQLGIPNEVEQAGRISHLYTHAIVGFSVWLTEDEIAKAQRLFSDGSLQMAVKSISKSEKVGIPIGLGVEGEIPTTTLQTGAQVVPTGIERINAALTSTKGNLGDVDVAVIDTGVDMQHPDLNVVGGVDCTSDTDKGWGHDGYGHGTHVAGTIGAKNNDFGVVGVAPGARIWSVKVLGDDGSGTTASVICGIDWVAAHPEIAVANMSLGGESHPTACNDGDPMHDAICVATEKTLFVVAAGNSAADAQGESPANYPEVITVSAFADFNGQPGGGALAPQDGCFAYSVDDELAAYSNYGQDVDISAPGTCILSTLPGETVDGTYTPEYGYASGTSMASPHVAGAVARFLALNPDQRQFARAQLLLWSQAHGGPVVGDHDQSPDALLYVGNGIPRHEAGPNDPPQG